MGNLHVWKLDIDHLSLWSLSYGKLAGFVAMGCGELKCLEMVVMSNECH